MNLYHYTTIENLALILKNRKIKFSRLDTVNDPLDGICGDYERTREIVYVSCFTKREDDSIPMWSLYTKDMDGVRIRFSKNLFGKVQNTVWE